MTGYSKLYNSLLMSTIWKESTPTRIVCITMLGLSDPDGLVDATVPGLAHVARVSVEECEAALKVLLSPDRHSLSQEHERRRIEVVDRGWRIFQTCMKGQL